MGLTLEQLQAMGAKPGVTPSTSSPAPTNQPAQSAPQPATSGSGITLEQLQSMGAKPGVTPQTPTQPTQSNQPDDSWTGEIAGRYNDAKTALSDAASGKINPLSGSLQLLGSVGGAVTDTVGKALENAPLGIGTAVKGLEGLVGQGVSKLASTDTGKSVIGAGQSFAQNHPELSGDIGAIGNIVGGVTAVTGAGALKSAVGKTIAKVAGKDALASVISDVTPSLKTAAQVGEAKAGGLTKTGLLGRIVPTVSKDATDVAKVVNEHIPEFQKLKTFTDKLNVTRETISNLADDLKKKVIDSGKNVIYPFKQLASEISRAEEPISLKGTPFEKQIAPLKKAAVALAQKSGGNISGLLDARKAFDDLVVKTYPKLYTADHHAMRGAVTAVRNVMNKMIDENLPKGVGFRDSLSDQSKLYRAVDALAPKAVDEIGSTRFSRLADNHPIVTKGIRAAKNVAIIGSGLEGAHGLYSHFFGSDNNQ